MPRFVVHDAPPVAGGTHALVIGVGSYPHLNGGNGRLCDEHEGLKQLTSPPVSARAFANWLIANFDNPNKPLASVALLLSEENNVVNGALSKYTNPRTNVEYELERAQVDIVDIAVQEWTARADSNVDNMTIFYFCGHGFAQGSDAALLLEDYGAKSFNALDGSIDLRKFHLGMPRVAATEQCFFIDACRAGSDTFLENHDSFGRPLVSSKKDARRGWPTRRGPVFYATLAGDSAYARANQSSVFTEALIKSLNGAGSDDRDGDWRVETTGLMDALEYFMKRECENGGMRVQAPATGDASRVHIHSVREPLVPVEVLCDPASETEYAAFGCSINGVPIDKRVPGDKKKWFIELRPGLHQFVATYPEKAYQPKSKTDYVRPAYRIISLEARP